MVWYEGIWHHMCGNYSSSSKPGALEGEFLLKWCLDGVEDVDASFHVLIVPLFHSLVLSFLQVTWQDHTFLLML